MSRAHHHHPNHQEESKEEFSEHPIFPPSRIYERSWHSSIPSQFDGVTIYLDGRSESDLNWKKGKEEALEAIEHGYTIMWNLDLGDLCALRHPLKHEGQFLSLTLALKHFQETMWSEFKSHTFGLILYRGSLDFSSHFRFDDSDETAFRQWLQELNLKEIYPLDFDQIRTHHEGKLLTTLFCRDVIIEYLTLLANHLPDSLPIYLFLDLTNSPFPSPLAQIQLLNPERYTRFHLALRALELPFQALGWETPTAEGYFGKESVVLPKAEHPTAGICLPPVDDHRPDHYKGFEKAIELLKERKIPFKFISENFLTAEWDGLDDLFYHPAGLTFQGKRKLQGFCAAGGTITPVDSLF